MGKVVFVRFYYLLIAGISPFIVYFFPSMMAYLIDWSIKEHRLPRRSNRLVAGKNVLEDFSVFNFDACTFDEVNLVMRGEGLNKGLDRSLPTFFVNPYIHNLKNFEQPWFCTSDRLVLDAYFGNPETQFHKRFFHGEYYNALFNMPLANWNQDLALLDSQKDSLLKARDAMLQARFGKKRKQFQSQLVLHKYRGCNVQVGSGILAVIGLLERSRKVNVYGWDGFIDDNLPSGYVACIWSMWRTFFDFHPGSRFAAIMINWHYAYRLLNELPVDRLNVSGRVNQLKDKHSLFEKISKVFYR